MTNLLLEVALLLSAAFAVLYLVRMFFGMVIPVNWYWGSAVSAFVGPALIALAIRVLDNGISAVESKNDA